MGRLSTTECTYLPTYPGGASKIGIGLGMMYRIGGLGVGKALRVTEAAGLGFLGVGILNTCMMIMGIFHHHHLGGRKARWVHCRSATGSEVMLGGSR